MLEDTSQRNQSLDQERTKLHSPQQEVWTTDGADYTTFFCQI